MNKAATRGSGLQNRKKAAAITVMAVVILSVFLLMRYLADGGPGAVPVPTGGMTVNPDDIYGIAGVKHNQVAGKAPSMAWIIHGNDLIVYGWSDISATIVFNVAVINTTTGKGWITGDAHNVPYGDTYSRTYSTSTSGSEKIPISDLTGGKIKTAEGLSGYKV
jgi:hypothetical protein